MFSRGGSIFGNFIDYIVGYICIEFVVYNLVTLLDIVNVNVAPFEIPQIRIGSRA